MSFTDPAQFAYENLTPREEAWIYLVRKKLLGFMDVDTFRKEFADLGYPSETEQLDPQRTADIAERLIVPYMNDGAEDNVLPTSRRPFIFAKRYLDSLVSQYGESIVKIKNGPPDNCTIKHLEQNLYQVKTSEVTGFVDIGQIMITRTFQRYYDKTTKKVYGYPLAVIMPSMWEWEFTERTKIVSCITMDAVQFTHKARMVTLKPKTIKLLGFESWVGPVLAVEELNAPVNTALYESYVNF